MSEVVGRVAALWRFPVKSMAGERLAQAELGWRGLRGDRQYAFHHVGDHSRFPWFTGRDMSGFVRYRALFRDPTDTGRSPVDVTAPDGATFALDAPELRERLSGEAGAAVELIQSGRGLYDAMPVSVVTTGLHAAVNAACGQPVDPRRFRINIVIDGDRAEEGWGERLLAFGDGEDGPRLLVQEPIERCVMVTIDPDTGVRAPELMKTVVRGFGNRIGMYASTGRPGTIRTGDAVRLL